MDEDVTTIHISKTLTSSIIMDLMNEYPNLEEITCSPSVYDRTSKKYIDALSQLDIEVKKKYNWGAKSKTNGAEYEVLRLSKKGLKPREIADRMDITLNRVYYLLRKTKSKPKNRKTKHNYEEIYALKEQGLSAREISEKLDIPLRSVYYILNKK